MCILSADGSNGALCVNGCRSCTTLSWSELFISHSLHSYEMVGVILRALHACRSCALIHYIYVINRRIALGMVVNDGS